MEDANIAQTPDEVLTSLRELSLFAGVPDEQLDEIARIVSESTSQRIMEALHRVPLFEGLDEEDLQRIADVSTTQVLEAEELLFEEGEEGDAFYVVLRGGVAMLKRAAGGAQEKLAIARAGDTFGEMALLNQAPRSASAKAVEKSHLLAVSREAFEDLLGGENLAVRLLRGLSKALWATSVRFAAKQREGAAAPAAGGQDRIREMSRILQAQMLPSRLPYVVGYDVAAGTRVPENGRGSGIWDWFLLGDGRTVLASIEVLGDGLPPAHYLAITRSLFRELGRDHSELGTLLRRANNALAAHRIEGLAQRVECGLLALGEDRAEWASAGKVPGAVARANGAFERLPSGGAPLGTQEGFEYDTVRVNLGPGDTIYLLSDVPREKMPGAPRVAEMLDSTDADEVVGAFQDVIEEARGNSGDDATAVIVRRILEDSSSVDFSEAEAAGNGASDLKLVRSGEDPFAGMEGPPTDQAAES